MILIVPIGTVDGAATEEIAKFIGSYYSRFGLTVEISDAIPPEPFLEAYNSSRRQFLGRAFLITLSELGRMRNARAVLGITSLDLYEEGLNFIFGLANSRLGAAVISTFRLRPEFYEELPNRRLFVERAIKEAMHELGHVFGLSHCPNRECVMHFSNSIIDTDVKGPLYCPTCLRKLERNLGVGR
ncbi:archaemetzincin family Zn-dependent metalloprotease [Thermococcus sp. GR6]|uniref:archaemetzincin family Zn-dependent metalloprotease n=1 Tax=Thermococcus sp. GR6 TaxID=1638256 RepID=UPI00143185AF|nr:archemetzincin [Thermococcus sp. GR6]